MTFFYKRVFPVLWIGMVALFIALPFVLHAFGGTTPGADFTFWLAPAIMIVVGYVMMRKLLFDLVDEVLDAGDALVVRNGPIEERVALSDIVNVGYSPFMNPPRVTLSLRNPGRLGERVTFCAPVSFLPFATSPIVDELIKRVDDARNLRSGHRR
jgi:hypothetical protein